MAAASDMMGRRGLVRPRVAPAVADRSLFSLYWRAGAESGPLGVNRRRLRGGSVAATMLEPGGWRLAEAGETLCRARDGREVVDCRGVLGLGIIAFRRGEQGWTDSCNEQSLAQRVARGRRGGVLEGSSLWACIGPKMAYFRVRDSADVYSLR